MARRNPPAPKFEELRDKYTRMYAAAKVLPGKWANAADRAAQCIIDAKRQLEVIEAKTGVPWQILGMLQMMEAGIFKDPQDGKWKLNFSRHLHNGDPLTGRTVKVPKGRPPVGSPPFTWEESALDAVKYDGLDKVDWTEAPTEQLLYDGEEYNGWGYFWYHKNCNTPYLWSGTDQYAKGKYDVDGHFDPELVSQQIGIVPVVKALDARGVWLKPAERVAQEDTCTDQTWCTEVFPEANSFRDDSIKAKDVAEAGSRSMSVLQLLKWKLGVGTGGVGIYEALKFITDGKDTISDVLEIVDRHLVTILKLAGVSTLVMVAFAIFFLAEAARDGRYDPRKADTDADPHAA